VPAGVIEDVEERAETLRTAWRLCRKVLSIAARILVGGRSGQEVEYGDGVLTRIGTFQKYYTQAELREYIETELQTEAIPAAPGVFYVFRDDELRQRFLAGRYRRRLAVPRKRISDFRRRPRLSQLQLALRRDIREFFGTYKKACETADDLLFTAGDADAIDAACQKSRIGRLSSNALFIHRSALASLDPVLRIYEGCARAYLGEIDDANIVKLHRFSGKVSYLSCPDFETLAHPRIVRSVKLVITYVGGTTLSFVLSPRRVSRTRAWRPFTKRSPNIDGALRCLQRPHEVEQGDDRGRDAQEQEYGRRDERNRGEHDGQ